MSDLMKQKTKQISLIKIKMILIMEKEELLKLVIMV